MRRLSPLVLAFLLTGVTPGLAKPAHCSTSDDGEYACDFTLTDTDGSFRITAHGKPAIMLNMTAPGRADGYAELGGRNVALPGEYVRSAADPACWVNTDTRDRVCAR